MHFWNNFIVPGDQRWFLQSSLCSFLARFKKNNSKHARINQKHGLEQQRPLVCSSNVTWRISIYFVSNFDSLKAELKAAQQAKWLKANIKLPLRARRQKLTFVPDKMWRASFRRKCWQHGGGRRGREGGGGGRGAKDSERKIRIARQDTWITVL